MDAQSRLAAMDKPQSPAQDADAQRLRTLLEINNAVISSLTREALFHAIAGALRRIMAFDRTAIFLHDAEKDVLRLFILESSLPTSYFTVAWRCPRRRATSVGPSSSSATGCAEI